MKREKHLARMGHYKRIKKLVGEPEVKILLW
jgi:hypothetical protein